MRANPLTYACTYCQALGKAPARPLDAQQRYAVQQCYVVEQKVLYGEMLGYSGIAGARMGKV